jgi:hypothetical protein
LQTTSIHLTVGVSPVTRLDVARAVLDEFASVAAFRSSLPMGTDPTDRDELVATVTKVMAEMVDAMRDEASTLGDGAATTLVRRHAERTRPEPVRPLAAFHAADRAAAVRVQWRHGLVAAVEQADGRVHLRLPDKVMSFPESCGAAVAALHRGITADAGSLPGLDHADGTVLLRRLLREAVVVSVTE